MRHVEYKYGCGARDGQTTEFGDYRPQVGDYVYVTDPATGLLELVTVRWVSWKAGVALIGVALPDDPPPPPPPPTV